MRCTPSPAQPLVADLLATLQANTTSTVLNFGHSPTIEVGRQLSPACRPADLTIPHQPLLAALGLLHDPSHLLASDLGAPHLWDTSRSLRAAQGTLPRIAGFTANLALVVFGCEDGGRRVMMYHQVEA